MGPPALGIRAVDEQRLAQRRQELSSLCVEMVALQRRMERLRTRALARRDQIRAARAQLHDDLRARRRVLQTDAAQAAVLILQAAAGVTAIAPDQLWIDYFALGGEATPEELEAILSGERPLYRSDHDRLVVAINDQLQEQGAGRPLAFWDGTR